MSHVLFFPWTKWQPLTCKRKGEKTHMCWAEEQRGEEASEESTGDGCLTGCGNTPFHSLVWQKNKHRATKLLQCPVLMDKRWLFPNETSWTTERETRSGQWESPSRTWHCCALGFWSTGPSESLPQLFWVLNHLTLPVSGLVASIKRATSAKQHFNRKKVNIKERTKNKHYFV